MKKILPIIAVFLLTATLAHSQNLMTPELLWKLGRVSGLGISKDGKYVVYNVSTPNAEVNKSSSKKYIVSLQDGITTEITNSDSLLKNTKISVDGKYLISDNEVKINKVFGSDIYPELSKSNVQVYDNLAYRHWDTWEDGKFSHVILSEVGNPSSKKDLLEGTAFDCPTKPFGGDEDYVWSNDGKVVVYVTKKKSGKDYATSTNTDLYAYDIATGKTTDLTEDMMGYDINPAFSKHNQLAWLSMKRDGYEADKQDIIVGIGNASKGSIVKTNLTEGRDDIHVESFIWGNEENTIYFTAPLDGTLQLFQVSFTNDLNATPAIKQITKGDFDITGILGQVGSTLAVTRTDMNHAAEIFTVDVANGQVKQLTHVNDQTYASLKMSRTERRMVKTTDGKEMLVWVIYPPDFDATKKYPALLYCQGGPQSPLTQFYSFRWNFQLMAANGYIVVAPNRRGMPGHGTKWNEDISKDWGGQVMKDYMSAIDDVSKETYVDKNRLGCVGASYGGYSVYYLAGNHNNKFKTFIAHDGVFDLRSMYGTTEELWFVNWDFGGPYWDKSNVAVQNALTKFNPINFVDKWNTPILIFQGGKDYRVPIEQGLQAFTAAQLKGIKSKLVYLPDENHWVLNAQNALVWQHEFYKWLAETLK